MTRPARLVAVDMDGTFLDAESAYDRVRFGRFNQRLQAAGARFVVASGNQYWQLLTYFDGFPDVFYIAENGALVATAERVLRVARSSQARWLPRWTSWTACPAFPPWHAA